MLAPQYIKYVEKSRVSADKDLLDSIYNALTTAASDPDIDTDTIIDTAGSNIGFSTLSPTGAADDFSSVVLDTLGQGLNGNAASVEGKLKSKIADSNDIQISVDSNGNYTVFLGTSINDASGITVGAGAN